MKKNVVWWFLGVVAFGVVAAWRFSASEPTRVDHFFLIDRSLSDAAPCVTLGSAVERIIASSAPGRSGWTFFATGSVETAYEPVRIPVQSAPAARRLIEGKEKVDRRNAAFVNDVVDSCNYLPQAESSPVFLGIKHVVAQARQQGGKPEVYVITDLQETSEPNIVAALKQPLKTRSPLPNPIDTSGVRLGICGYAQTIGRDPSKGSKSGAVPPGGGLLSFTAPRSAESADRILEVWTALFKQPASVDFAPFCF